MKQQLCKKWTLDKTTCRLISRTETLELEQKQVVALTLLSGNAGNVTKKSDILDAVWPDTVVSEDAIYVLINSLRNILNDNVRNPEYIKTISGKGYLWLKPVIGKRQRVLGYEVRRFGIFCMMVVVACAAYYEKVSGLYSSEKNHELPYQVKQDLIKARYLLANHPGSETEALSLLKSADALEPNNASILESLVSVLFIKSIHGGLTRSDHKIAFNHTLKKLQNLLPDNKVAHLYKARSLFLFERDHILADKHFQHSLKTANSHSHYGQFLLAHRQFKLALQHINQYQLLDPSGYSSESVAWVYLMSGNFAQAFKELDKLKQYSKGSYYYHVCLQALYEEMGDEIKSFDELIWLMKRGGYTDADIAAISTNFTKTGLKGAYTWLLRVDQKRLSIGQYSPPMSLARYAVSAGDPKLAISYLQQAVAQQQPSVMWVATDPKFNAIHNEPDFISLLKTLNLSI
ncbi:winged helix-turn-helix domain-containing protein [Pseudoalteromonas aurantia]|uniref:winged helix-turn-helix domain-containing protein n=1 Tax=Pseudoalteromonas aurantia TaxID=43654 RepID=UPI001487610E|nr:winged helix-turn-helix domain-containing protein [Pseudoalteromonas aurantia]